MTEMTLAAARAKHAELGAIIAALMARPTTTVAVAATDIQLHDGEHYAGAVLNDDGTVKHHLVLMADRPDGNVDWHNAKKWAASIGGELPDRQEAALIYANCKPHVDGAWHWTSEQHTNESYAWICGFYDGIQTGDRKDDYHAARAVRRVTP